MIHRYMYLNSTRSSHVIEKRTQMLHGEKTTYHTALCGRGPRIHPEWDLSFMPTKRVCGTCQEVLTWRAKVMQRKYRTLQPLRSYKGKPWSLPQGSESIRIKLDEYGFWVVFQGIGEVELMLNGVERKTELFECIFDPTQPEPAPMPLFEVQP